MVHWKQLAARRSASNASGLARQQTNEDDAAGIHAAERADVQQINEYCKQRHHGKVRCEWTEQKGRILRSSGAVATGAVILREPPLHAVGTGGGDPIFNRLEELSKERSEAFVYEAVWYWVALSSLRACQVPAAGVFGGSVHRASRPIEDEAQRRLLLLHQNDVTEASAASRLLVDEFGLAPLLDALDLERLIQAWMLNCFESSDDAYAVYFAVSFMSHSCLPNACWHYEGDQFVLVARADIAAGDEICISYVSEDELLESVPVRRGRLRESKHFLCHCVRCDGEADLSRGFWVGRCPGGLCFAMPATECDELVGATCELTDYEIRLLLQEEHALEEKLIGWELLLEHGGPGKYSGVLQQVEAAAARAQKSLAQHFLMERAWRILATLYERNGRPEDAEDATSKRLVFQEAAFPGLSGSHAWTLEVQGDMILRHCGALTEPVVRVQSAAAARKIAERAPDMYMASLRILRIMFTEKHSYYTSCHRKAVQLLGEMEAHLAGAKSGDDSSEGSEGSVRDSVSRSTRGSVEDIASRRIAIETSECLGVLL